MKPILAEGYAYGLLRRDVSALKENAALERKWRGEREARIRKVAREHPDMEIELIAERFGCAEYDIMRVLRKAGIGREKDMIATLYRNGLIASPAVEINMIDVALSRTLTPEGKRTRAAYYSAENYRHWSAKERKIARTKVRRIHQTHTRRRG